MSVRHLFRQPILYCRQLRASPTPPLQLLSAFPVANTLIPIHRRSYADISRNPRDLDIRKIHDKIRYIDAEGNYQGVQFLWYILVIMDQENYHLVCVNPHVTEEPPTCKLISKEKLRAAHLAKKAKSIKNPNKVTKTIELSWATAPHDLGHKIRKITEFLQKGYKVEVIFGIKRGMAKQQLSRMEEIVDQVRAQAVEYGREWKAAEGVIGVQYLVYFEGRRPKVVVDPVGGAEVVGGNSTEGTKVVGENPVQEADIVGENPAEETKVVENPTGEADAAEENPAGEATVVGENPMEEMKVVEENPAGEAKVVEENPVGEAGVVEENPTGEAKVVGESPAEETKVVEENPEGEEEVVEENPVEETKVVEESPVGEAGIVEENAVGEVEVIEENAVGGAEIVEENAVGEVEVVEENAVGEVETVEENAVGEVEVFEENAVEETKAVEEDPVEEAKVVEEKKEEKPHSIWSYCKTLVSWVYRR